MSETTPAAAPAAPAEPKLAPRSGDTVATDKEAVVKEAPAVADTKEATLEDYVSTMEVDAEHGSTST
jgi:hypothetical protein